MSDGFDSIKRKLDILKKLKSNHSTSGRKKTIDLSTFQFSHGWEKISGLVHIKRERIPFKTQFMARQASPLIPDSRKISDCLFFDTETTGLSGGAGTYIFLIGFAYYEKSSVFLEQYFLADFPGEPEFLTSFSHFFTDSRLLISYNGKGFDSHLLRTRFAMNGIPLEINNQLDLLFLSRKFFKRKIGPCSLTDVEKNVLNIKRENDVPGFEVPGRYFQFLTSAEESVINPVIKHNGQDILSLVHLYELFLQISNGELPAKPLDLSAAGQYLLDHHDKKGLKILQKSFEQGNDRSGQILSFYYKGRGDWEKAIRLWKDMASTKKSLLASLELAKYYEHREKNFTESLKWLDAVSSLPLQEQNRKDLAKRRNRLLRKLKKNSGEGI